MDSGAGVTCPVHHRTAVFHCHIYNRRVFNQASMSIKYVLTSTVQLHSAHERSFDAILHWLEASSLIPTGV